MGKKSEWPVTFDASYSKVAREDFNLELWAGIGSLGNPVHLGRHDDSQADPPAGSRSSRPRRTTRTPPS